MMFVQFMAPFPLAIMPVQSEDVCYRENPEYRDGGLKDESIWRKGEVWKVRVGGFRRLVEEPVAATRKTGGSGRWL